MSICIVYFSVDGHTRALAEAIAKGSAARLFDVTALSDADWRALDSAGAVIMGAPTYMGGLPTPFVQFIEEAATRWDTGQWRDKLAGGFSTAMHPAGDKLNVLTSMFIFAAQMGIIWIGNAETGAPVVAENEGINTDGSWVGVTASVPREGDEILSGGDLETARRYGVRMRAALEKWKR
ncbi:flavodoxin domain-containing protein [Planktotalea sp.]|uniref:flavodoxin family protein n=1 Tax=Planktotalea sp. TaxID=2029877 RepID=UPI0025E27A14|nr:flavodoxin domain-containing protein [Planktotalea sp.]